MAMKFEPKKCPGIRKNPPRAAPKVGRLATPRLSKEGLLQRGRKFCQMQGVWSYGYDWPWHAVLWHAMACGEQPELPTICLSSAHPLFDMASHSFRIDFKIQDDAELKFCCG